MRKKHTPTEDIKPIEKYAVLFCLTCGGNDIELHKWVSKTTVALHCNSCNKDTALSNFTIGTVELRDYQKTDALDSVQYRGKSIGELPPWYASLPEEVKVEDPFLEKVKNAVESGFCKVHNVSSLLDLADGGDVSLAKIASCCEAYRSFVIKRVHLVLDEIGMQSRLIIHTANIISPTKKETN